MSDADSGRKGRLPVLRRVHGFRKDRWPRTEAALSLRYANQGSGASASDQPASDQPASDRAASDQPASDQAGSGHLLGPGSEQAGYPDLVALFREGPFGTVLADPPWRFVNRTGKVAPEHRRLSRYETLSAKDIASIPVGEMMASRSHCYLWVPNALLAEGLMVLENWGFTYKGNLVWHKVRKDGGSDGRGVGFYFRNVTEMVLFGTRGKLRTFAPGRTTVNLFASRKREHSRKPDELYGIIEACSPGPYLELFARYPHLGWTAWGKEAGVETVPQGRQYPSYR